MRTEADFRGISRDSINDRASCEILPQSKQFNQKDKTRHLYLTSLLTIECRLSCFFPLNTPHKHTIILTILYSFTCSSHNNRGRVGRHTPAPQIRLPQNNLCFQEPLSPFRLTFKDPRLEQSRKKHSPLQTTPTVVKESPLSLSECPPDS